jgi:ABC-2 type transport system ATP-binding protein
VSGTGLATEIIRALDSGGISVDNLELHQPSLDDVFFALTGHPSDESSSESNEVKVEVRV